MVPLKQSLPSSPETSAKQIFVWVDTVFHQEAEAQHFMIGRPDDLSRRWKLGVETSPYPDCVSVCVCVCVCARALVFVCVGVPSKDMG